MAKYKTKSTEIEAIKFTRDNFEVVEAFTNDKAKHLLVHLDGQVSCELECKNMVVRVMENRYIVKLPNGDFYICSEDSFEELYERVED